MKRNNPDKLEYYLSNNRKVFSNIFPFSLTPENTFHLDLSINNTEINAIDICDNNVFDEYLSKKVLEKSQKVPVGGYNERRTLYSTSDHFGSGEGGRDIHLGVDIWLEAGTPVAAPFDSTIHSFANNSNYRDYGPTIILEHRVRDLKFYSLYGHLSTESIVEIAPGKRIHAGEIFASVGATKENGSWPPHLHFQLIRDIGEHTGDFPGVSSIEQREYFLSLCPNPDLLFALNLPY